MLISEIENIFKEIFKNGVVKTVETVYEKSDSGLRLVISIHSLSVEDTIIIHTKFIFKTDLEKVNLTDNSFNYLYDINCIYRQINFSDIDNLKHKLIEIVESNKFGKDIQILSEFIDTPALLLNHYFNKNDITKYSVTEVTYEPKFKIKPCNETTFDFVINISNNYDVNLTISKITDKDIKYKFIFKLLEETETIEVDKLENIHYTIGGKLIEMLDKLIK